MSFVRSRHGPSVVSPRGCYCVTVLVHCNNQVKGATPERLSECRGLADRVMPVADLGVQLAQLMGGDASDPDPERERILDVAREEFISHGFRRTAIGDIARRAGVSRPTVYRRCGDKDDIVLAVVVREVLEFFGQLAESVTSASSAAERAVEGFVAGMRETRRNPLVAAIKKFEPETLTTFLASDRGQGLDMVRTGMAIALVDDAFPLDAAQRAAELMVRITASLLLSPADVLPTDTDEAARSFASTYFVPLIMASRAEVDRDRR